MNSLSKKCKKFLCFILATVIGLLLSSTAFAEKKINIDNSEIDSFIKSQMKSYSIPGLSLGIVIGDKTSYTKGYGKADSSGRAVTPQTPFLLGSVSKSFTALAIMQLRDKGKINLDEPISKYLPWFKATYKGKSRQITVRQLLCHTSGMKDFYDAMEDGSKTISYVARNRLNGTKLKTLPGTVCYYSNSNYILAGEIIQTVSKQSYQDYIKANIFLPLEMKHSYVSKEDAQKDSLASGYRKWFGIPVKADVEYFEYCLPVGQIISCSEDMTHYLIALMNEGRYNNTSILSPEGIKELFKPEAEEESVPTGIEGDKNYYAFGWRVIYNNNKISLYQHSGETANYHSNIIINPESGFGVIQIDNFGGDPSYIRPGIGVMDLLSGKKPQETNNLHKIYILMRILTAVLLVLLLIPILRLKTWKKRIAKSKGRLILNISIMLLINFTLPLLALSCYPGMFDVNWKATMNIYPDISWTIIISSVILLLTGIFKAGLIIPLLREKKNLGL